MSGKKFSLFPRKRKNGKAVYYAQFKLPSGKWSTAKSTGQTNRSLAESWCIEYMQAGGIVQRENVTLAEFSENFYSFNGEWATDLKISGKRISERQCLDKAAILKTRVLPHLGEYKLTSINKAVIKQFRNMLFQEGYSGSSINNTLSTLKPILETAEDAGLIQAVPKIERAANTPKLRRGVLTPEEVKELFKNPYHWPDYRFYTINLAGAITGLRRGELLALQINDVKCSYITVTRSWNYNLQRLNETTKTGKARTVIIPGILQQAIAELTGMNPYRDNPEAFLFFSGKPDGPLDAKDVSTSFNRQLRAIGIDERTRKERGLTFHSHRHFFNSLLINSKIPLAKVQSITGHVTIDMSEGTYYHADDMKDVLQVQESFFQGINEATQPGGHDVHR